MEPVFAEATLNHTVRNGIRRIGIRSIAGAVNTGKVVIVLILLVKARLLVKLANGSGKLFIATVAAELTLRVKLNNLVAFMAMVTTGKAESSQILASRFRISLHLARCTSVQWLSGDVALQ